MTHLNIEIKAQCTSPVTIREYLKSHHADFRGIDHQVDTYFNSATGRLKMREGNIENNLIYYERNDEPGAKESNFQLVTTLDAKGLKDILVKSLGIQAIVEKKREIYFIGNVKFHIDEVVGLGSFVEIEASNLNADLPIEELRAQCQYYLTEFGIRSEDLIDVSYSDLLLRPAKDHTP